MLLPVLQPWSVQKCFNKLSERRSDLEVKYDSTNGTRSWRPLNRWTIRNPKEQWYKSLTLTVNWPQLGLGQGVKYVKCEKKTCHDQLGVYCKRNGDTWCKLSGMVFLKVILSSSGNDVNKYPQNHRVFKLFIIFSSHSFGRKYITGK